jgi:hypothetical protein
VDHQPASPIPLLSVVVTVVEGGAALVRCLDALAGQTAAEGVEVIVPYDGSIPDTPSLATRYPSVRFTDMGAASTAGRRNAFSEHGLYEQRRAAGLRAARGLLVAMLEDRGAPRPDWSAAMIDLHARMPCGAIGGVVEHGGGGALRWALFFCDFGRYQPVLRGCTVEYLSDVNICYKREALEAVRNLWQEVYQESTVNWALRRCGYELHLSPAPVVVEERGEARLWPIMRERLHWARIFAHVRGREAPSPLNCVAWAAATPVLPTLLFVRHLRRQLTLRRHLAEFARAALPMLVLLHCWSLGECIGYLESVPMKRN